MAWKPTTKQLWILEYLREHAGAKASAIADASPVDVVESAAFNAKFPDGQILSGEPYELRSIYPALALASLKRLEKEGLVFREETSSHPNGYPYRWFLTAKAGERAAAEDPRR